MAVDSGLFEFKAIGSRRPTVRLHEDRQTPVWQLNTVLLIHPQSKQRKKQKADDELDEPRVSLRRHNRKPIRVRLQLLVAFYLVQRYVPWLDFGQQRENVRRPASVTQAQRKTTNETEELVEHA